MVNHIPASFEQQDGQQKTEISKVGKSSQLFLVFCLVIALAVVFFSHKHLPPPRSAQDTPLDEFSEERAWRHVETLASLGVRIISIFLP